MNVHAAKTQLSRLLKEVEAGHEVVIARDGRPVARLVPAEHTENVVLGRGRGSMTVPDDFDAPLPKRLLERFYR